MKKIILLTVCLLVSYVNFGQCPVGNITLSTQAEVDAFTTNFPGCTELRGSLNVSGSDIVDLTPLSVITLIGTDGFGGLYIIGNPLLPNLDGLENITDLNGGSVFVENNVSLTSISGLSGFSGFLNGDQILIKDNPVLASLNGLNNVTHPGVDDVIIWNNDALTDLSGLESLIGADDILIIDNDGLINLNGLSAFESTGSFWVRDNDALTSLDGMGTNGSIYDIEIENNPLLTNINGLLGYGDDFGALALIKDNPALTSLAGLDAFENFEELIIDNNDQLTDLSGLENLTNSSVGGSVIQILNNDQLANIAALANVDSNSPTLVEITNNPNLSVCANVFVCEYLQNGGNATINNNAAGCDSVPEILAICNATLNQISGQIQFDFNSNDCDPNDFAASNLLVEITDGVNDYSTLTDAEGNYSRFLNVDGSFTIRIAAGSLPPLFVSDPVSVNTTFSGFGNEEIIDFCLSATETINDLKIVQIPLNDAQPGFEANYEMVYENLGTTLQSDVLTLSFPDDRVSFVAASPAPDSASGNVLSWNYTDLQPFESRSILITFDLFIPPTNESGDILEYVAEILPISGDENETDNTYHLDQVVVNSQDPNDKQVAQGPEIDEAEVGEYLDYIVRFQNLGTADAINVVIEDVLDANLQWATLRTLSASHSYRTEIQNGNQLSFIFEDINLPPEVNDPEGSKGYIAFQVRTDNALILGDEVSNTAAIYFDFNPAVITNTVTTIVGDQVPPVAICQPLTVSLDPSGQATITAADIDNGSNDSNGIASLELDITSFDCSNLGVNTVTLTVTDNYGNMSECTAIVTVIDDLPPVFDSATLPQDQTKLTDETGIYLLEDFTAGILAEDNCTSEVILTQSPAVNEPLTPGVYDITITATDDFSNETEYSFELTVELLLGNSNFSIEQNITLYPNPVSDILHIETSNVIQLEKVTIYSIRGEKMMVVSVKNINLSYLSNGLYFALIETDRGNVVRKIIKN